MGLQKEVMVCYLCWLAKDSLIDEVIMSRAILTTQSTVSFCAVLVEVSSLSSQ